MIKNEEVFYIGRITKFRGISGEVEMLFTDDVFDRGSCDYFVLEMDGILVPFFWEEYKFKNNETAIIQFEDFHNEHEAKKIVGAKVYYPKSALPEEDDEQALSSWKALTGFTIYNSDGKELGTVQTVDDSSANILFYILTKEGNELLIPFHEDFLVDYQIKDRTLTLQLPEGLLDLNL